MHQMYNRLQQTVITTTDYNNKLQQTTTDYNRLQQKGCQETKTNK